MLPGKDLIQVQVFGTGCDRQFLIVVLKNRASVLNFENEFLAIEYIAVWLAQNRQQHFLRFPVNVKEAGITRVLSLLQDIEPPRIVQAGAHVIGDDIENQPHVSGLQCRHELVEFLRCADFGIDLRRIDHVVSMCAAWACFQYWRSVNVGNAQVVEVVNDADRINETKIAIELETVSRDRNSHDAFFNSGTVMQNPAARRIRASRSLLAVVKVPMKADVAVHQSCNSFSKSSTAWG